MKRLRLAVAAALALLLLPGLTATADDLGRGPALDPHHLPLGDGKVSDAPRAGYIFACERHFVPGRGGAAADAPWIHGATWDATAKPAVRGRVLWPEAQFRIALEGAGRDVYRLVAGNDLPLEAPTGQFPIAADDPAFLYDRNPNSIRAQRLVWRLPRDPVPAARPSCVPMGPIGIAINGVLFFNALDEGGRDAVAHEVQDRCHGHPQQRGAYHYHGPSPCLPGAQGRNRIIGYAIDGFAITSRYDAAGRELTDADLDACHGRIDRIDWDGRRRRLYHYVLTRDYPYTIGCFRGSPLRLPRGPGGPPDFPPPGAPR